MIRLSKRLPPAGTWDATLTLTLNDRARARLRVTLDDGRGAGLFLERGPPLQEGDCLGDGAGLVVRVRAAPESLSSATCPDPLLLARACYHLGNRHVPLQLGPGQLRYPHDHVLDDLLRGLGLTVEHVTAPFQPEAGAYAHAHAHTQAQAHEH
jgi:urease accessory protein